MGLNISNYEKYIGTKVIKAEPMTVTEAQVLGVEIKPATVEENGYLVEYKDGYKSWSPKSVFDKHISLMRTSKTDFVLSMMSYVTALLSLEHH